MKLVSLLAITTLSLGLLTGCSGGADDGAEQPVGDPSQEEIKKAAGNWDCSADDDANFAIEELSIATKAGKTKAYLDMSGPGDFLETFSYKSTITTQPNGDVVVKGTNFELTITAKVDAKTKEHAASLRAVGPKSAELYAGETITAKMSCSPK